MQKNLGGPFSPFLFGDDDDTVTWDVAGIPNENQKHFFSLERKKKSPLNADFSRVPTLIIIITITILVSSVACAYQNTEGNQITWTFPK